MSIAALSAGTTLTFIEPDTVLPRLLKQVQQDLDTLRLGALTDTDLAIWRTEEGTTYVDGMRSCYWNCIQDLNINPLLFSSRVKENDSNCQR